MPLNVSQGRINLISTLSVLVLSTLSNFYLTPFFIRYSGIEGLAVIRVALTIPVYIGLISLALMASFSRFLAVSRSEDSKENEYSVIMSTAFYSLLLFFMIVGFFAAYLSAVFSVSHSEGLLYFCMYLYCAVSTLAVFFTLPYYADNKQGVYNLTKFVCLFFQTVLIVILLPIDDDLSVVGFSFLGASIISLIYGWGVFVRYRAEHGLVLSVRYFDLEKLKSMLHMSKWVFVESSGVLFLFTVDLLIVVYLMGSKVGGEYSVYIQVLAAFIAISKALGAVYGPRVVSFFGSGDIDGLRRLVNESIFYIGAFLSLVMSYIAAYPDVMLSIWLGQSYPLVEFMLSQSFLVAPIVLSTTVFSYVFSAYLRVKIPALVTVGLGSVYILFVYLMLTSYSEGVGGVALGLIVILAIKNIVFYFYYAWKAGSVYIFQISKTLLFLCFLNFFLSGFYNAVSMLIGEKAVLLMLLVGLLGGVITVLLCLLFRRNMIGV